ncbi:hypothetical protein [Trinickia soli]|uniref:hypothetical protein n=1 Tax=Trinickia soli TaxID=380675 RepID=UPI001304A7F8|nr:hypothetical protein [Trinickia soli]
MVYSIDAGNFSGLCYCKRRAIIAPQTLFTPEERALPAHGAPQEIPKGEKPGKAHSQA